MTLAIRDLTNSPATDESTSPGPCHWSNKPPLNATETPFAAVTNAWFCCASRAAGSAPSPSRPRPFRFANHALVTSGNFRPRRAVGFRLRLGGGVALPLPSAKRSSPPSAPLLRPPTADRSPVSVANASAYDERRSILSNAVPRLNSFDRNGLNADPPFGQRNKSRRERSHPDNR